MDGPAGQRSVLRISGFEILHHLLLAATISCVMLLFESTNVYQAVDNFTHYILGSARFRERWSGDARPRQTDQGSLSLEEYPHAVIVPESLSYGAIGPEAKSILANVIEQVAQGRPRLIAVTHDVAPFEGDVDPREQWGGRGQSDIDRALDSAARQGIHVVVLTPYFGTDAMGQLRYDWVRARCAADVHFGLPVPRPPELPVYDYSRKSVSVGMVASRLVGGHEHDDADEFDVCHAANAAGRNIDDFSRRIAVVPTTHDFTTASPINTAFFSTDRNLRFVREVPPTALHPQPTIEIGARLPDSAIVFIGDANFEVRTFNNAMVAPAVMFAAEYFSETHPVQHSASRGFLVHMVLGVLLGYLFGVLWRKQTALTTVLKQTPAAPFGRKLRAYLWARAWLLIVLLSLPLILKAIFSVSGWMLRKEIWLNPLPLAIGMFIDALLHSYEGEPHKEPVTLRAHLNDHPDMALQVLFVAFVLVKVFAFGPDH